MVYILVIWRNLISMPILDRLEYSFPYGTGKVELYLDSLVIGTILLCGSLYRLELSSLLFVFATLTVNATSSTKHLRLNEKFSILWHKHWVIVPDREWRD